MSKSNGSNKPRERFETPKQPTIEGMRELFGQIVKLQANVLSIENVLISSLAEIKGVEKEEVLDELDEEYQKCLAKISSLYRKT